MKFSELHARHTARASSCITAHGHFLPSHFLAVQAWFACIIVHVLQVGPNEQADEMARPASKGLTECRRRVLLEITRFWDEHGYSPSFDDLGEALEIGKNAVAGHLKALQARGYITWAPGKGRTIQVLKKAPAEAAT